MEFLIFTKYNKAILREVILKRYLFNPVKIVINLLEIIIAFILYFTGTLDSFFDGYGIWFAVLFSAFVFLNYWIMLGVNLLSVKRNAALGMEQTVRFSEAAIEVKSKTPEGDIERTLEYTSVTRVTGYSSFYHITTAEGGAFLVDKNGFTEGNYADFEHFLPTVIPPEKIKLKKSKEV